MQSSTTANTPRPGRSRQQVSTLYTSRQVAMPAGRPRSEESWIDLASQPSSTSLSSAAGDIVTTGLRIEQESTVRRRRRTRTQLPLPSFNSSDSPIATSDMSSQEEYTESESESDRVLGSSNEGLIQAHGHHSEEIATSDEDENRTAVNYTLRTEEHHVFTPPPNAFSHPPSSQSARHVSAPCPDSYFPQMSTRSTPQIRHSLPPQQRVVEHSPYNAIAPSYNAAAAHHEAALRASLSTLLSCAAAARGLPKTRVQSGPAPQLRPSTRIEANTLRLIPASALPPSHAQRGTAVEPSFMPTIRQRSLSSTSQSAGAHSPDILEVYKRKARPGRASSRDQRASKKHRSSSTSSSATMYSADELVSPTLLTWLVSAGVVVVLSAISYSAGYTIGRGSGKVETALLGGGDVGCAGEVGRAGLGLRRLQFTAQV